MNPDQLTEKIIKACYEVHTELGVGFVERVYENARFSLLYENLDWELLHSIPFKCIFEIK